MTEDLWHFTRKDFAQDVFTALTQGPGFAFTLTGPRRSGKTSFLLKDIAPLAKAEGHQVVYVSFWTNSSPTDLLLAAIVESQENRHLPSRLSDVKSIVQRVSIAGLNLTLDIGPDGHHSAEDDIQVLDKILGEMADAKCPPILLLDEFQAAAETEQGPEFLAAFRSILDKRRDGLRSIFCGSSQIGMRRVFSDREAPFYRFATPVTLPPLGEDFVRHQMQAFHQTFRAEVSIADALDSFATLGANPAAFRSWLQARAFRPDITANDLLTEMQQDMVAQTRFDENWIELSPSRRAVLRIIAEGFDQLYGQEATTRLDAITGGKAPTTSERQAAFRLFRRRGLVQTLEKEIEILHPLVRDWILARPESEFHS
ncbi:MAG: ATP-binding protein [Pseudomonadota bacterium]